MEERRAVRQPIVAPVIPSASCTLTTLAQHLPSKERKALLVQISPLAKDHFPEPTDLSSFWL